MSSTSIKPILKTDNALRRNLINSLEGLDVYQRVNQSNENMTRNTMQSLDNVLIQMQKHLTFVRRVFQRLCRKHHSMSYENNPGKLPSMNQPNKVSIL
ncbi:hypothetical protein ANTRET_LOCUS10472 [Anthophora retusa]